MLYPLNGYGISLQVEARAVTGSLFRLSAVTVADLEAGEICPRDVLLDHQSRIEAVNPRVNALVTFRARAFPRRPPRGQFGRRARAALRPADPDQGCVSG